MWLLKVCEVPMAEVDRMDSLANSYIWKWLGLARCSTDPCWSSLRNPKAQGTSKEKAHLVLQLHRAQVEGASVSSLRSTTAVPGWNRGVST